MYLKFAENDGNACVLITSVLRVSFCLCEDLAHLIFAKVHGDEDSN